MAPRSTWKGFINLSLVSVPVKAYSASESGGTIHLNQLHADCHSRIQLRTVCPSCGDVSRNDIVKGYEYAKDQYVVIDLDELENLRAEDEGKAIRIDRFIHPDQLDPLYFTETSYYLLPDGVAGQKPFALLCDAMQRKNLYCVANVVLHNKEQLVLVRPVDRVLCMTVLKHATQVKAASAFRDELGETRASKDEYKLAEALIDGTTADKFDIARYKDKYTDRLSQLIEAKVEGKELVASPRAEARPVINLMEALRASVEEIRAPQSKPAKIAQRKGKPAKSDAREMLAQKLSASKKKGQQRKSKTG
jgi:DNA end-binding protein Ku